MTKVLENMKPYVHRCRN